MMQITLYNSLTKSKDPFHPINPKKVGMYVCGPTVYERPHLGNARAVVVYDLLYRLLRYVYGEDHVVYVRNITDVDDKINHAAKEKGISIQALTKEISDYFHRDIAAIHCLPPNIEPKATEHIAQMISIIEQLIAGGHAYIAGQHVYFSVESYADYCNLSGRTLEDLFSGVRIEVSEHKRHPADFVLWKPADADDDPSSVFASPFGAGRPGWHIECSAMSNTYLGADFDIHGGGVDLLFPHHTNEIAQSCSCFAGSHYARFWIHNGFLTVAGEKMSKSLGNFLTVKQVLEQGIKGETIRYALLATHYRKPLNWNDKAVSDASKALDSMYRIMQATKDTPMDQTVDISEITSALCDDLNVVLALAKLHALTSDFHKAQSQTEKMICASKIKKACMLLGFLQTHPDDWFGHKEDQNISAIIEKRNLAKQAKNWGVADQIRTELGQMGVIIEDHPDGTSSWRMSK